jgi:hypothetical protein
VTNGACDGVGLNPDRKVREEQYQRWYEGSDQRGGTVGGRWLQKEVADHSTGGGEEGNVRKEARGCRSKSQDVRMHVVVLTNVGSDWYLQYQQW